MARLFDENRALEDKAFNVMEQFQMNKILILLLIVKGTVSLALRTITTSVRSRTNTTKGGV